ncbi:MAG TPA: HD-GYP domain-containing protein, partial [Plasticicumulans sp.]|nr:HD-GYP domain-containing protein [Plasticicumulans sp.]
MALPPDARRPGADVLADPAGYFEDLERVAAGSTALPALRCLLVTAALRDDDTGRHTVRVGYMAELIGRRLGLDEDTCLRLRASAPLHDIGKLAIPDAILNKPGPLDATEMAVMRRHAEFGERILASTGEPLFRMAADIAGAHHEHYDGSGYPRGLRRDAIPLAARITAVCDFYDALRMDRVYRKALPDATVLGWMQEQRGRAFD